LSLPTKTEIIPTWPRHVRFTTRWVARCQANTCPFCRRGDFRNCRNLKIPGISYDGGYQQYMIAPMEALVAVPESLTDAEAAPLLCAGITTYNALRHSGAMPGDLFAVLGIGGLGHLGIQFADKFGYKVAAVGRGSESGALAKKLGASVYIDNKVTNPVKSLQKLGGAPVILATAPSSKAMSQLFDGLGPNGKLMVIGVTFDPRGRTGTAHYWKSSDSRLGCGYASSGFRGHAALRGIDRRASND
jgi:D-arabinose 1-dehydrogenase-like Zn-dependent alcohol dehydrogenase